MFKTLLIIGGAVALCTGTTIQEQSPAKAAVFAEADRCRSSGLTTLKNFCKATLNRKIRMMPGYSFFRKHKAQMRLFT